MIFKLMVLTSNLAAGENGAEKAARTSTVAMDNQ